MNNHDSIVQFMNKMRIVRNLATFTVATSRSSALNKNISRLLATKVAVKDLNVENINKTEWDSAQPYEKIPGPGKWSLLKSFIPGGKFYNKSRQYISKTLRQEYGDIVKLPGAFKQKDVILAFNPDYFEKIYRHDGVWPSRLIFQTLIHFRHELRPEIFKETGTLLTTNGEEWGKLRSIVNPIVMQPKTVRIYVPRTDSTTKTFIERIRQIRDPNTLELPENFEAEINAWSLEQICLIGLDTQLGLIGNEDANSDAQKLIQAINTTFSVLGEIEFKPSIWKYYETPSYKKLIEAYHVLADIPLKYIDEAIERYKLIEKDDKRNENEKSIVERLVKINKNIAVVMAMDMFFAGIDTTTSAATACMLSLAKNPEKQEKLRQEIRKVLPERDTPITEQILKNLPYLRAVIKESIRKYPIVYEFLRTTQVNFVLGEYQIPCNTDILLQQTHSYKDEKYFSEPDKFIPERWLRDQVESDVRADECPVSATKPSNPFAYLPFGFGHRMCVGKRLLDMELEILLARMIRNFNIEYNYEDNDVFELRLIYTPVKPLKFKLTDLEN